MIYRRELRIDHAASDAFAWHLRDGALERLLPPWQNARVVARTGPVTAPGAEVVLENLADTQAVLDHLL